MNNNNNQHIDEILQNIREIMDDKSEDPKPTEKCDNGKNEMDMIELSEMLPENDNEDASKNDKKNEIYVKDENNMEKHNEIKPIINLTKQTVVADVSSKINEFLTKVHANNKEKNKDRGLDLEDLVSSLIIPYLSDWLNKNLPHMVDDILKNEIRKLIDK